MSLIDDIRKDAEAGTLGPFEACDVGDYGDYDGECLVILGDDLRIAVVLGSHIEAQTNARRIARVPEMEAALLAADALAEVAEGANSAINKSFAAGSEEREGGSARRQGKLGDQIRDWQESLRDALDAYRKAMEAAQ